MHQPSERDGGAVVIIVRIARRWAVFLVLLRGGAAGTGAGGGGRGAGAGARDTVEPESCGNDDRPKGKRSECHLGDGAADPVQGSARDRRR